MTQRSYKTKLKISQTMKGTSNFAGQTHSIGSKAKISDRRGHYDPIGTKKWFVHNDSGVTKRKTQNPGGLFRRGRTPGRSEGIEMLNFTNFLLESERKYHYDLGHKTAMRGDERGETSDNFGPYAKHYNAGYDAGRAEKAKTKPNVVGKDSYGRSIIKTEDNINELSRDTLSSYVRKASKDDQLVYKASKGTPSKLGPDYVRHGTITKVYPDNRRVGMKKALDKIDVKRKESEKLQKRMKTEMRGPQRGSQDRIQTAAQKRKEQEFNKRAGIIEPEEAPSSFAGKTKPKPYYR